MWLSSTSPRRLPWPTHPRPGPSPTLRAITGCSACSTVGRRISFGPKIANALIASSFVFPSGRARKVEGGYRLQGHWPFSSGVDCCAWNMLAGIVSSDDEADGIEYRIFLVPRKDYRIIDMWNAAGLKGTGSNDVAVDDVFVEGWMTLSVAEIAGGPSPGSVVNPNPLYALPVFCAVSLSCCPGWRSVTPRAASKTTSRSHGTAQPPTAAPSSAIFSPRRSRLPKRPRRSTPRVSSCARPASRRCPMRRRGHIPDMAVKTGWRRDGAYAVNLCTEAVSLLFCSERGARIVRRRSAAAAVP